MRIAKKCVLAASPLVMAMLVSPSAAARNSKETALRAEMTRLENVAKAAKSADERDRAISQMDDVLQQCGKLKGCQIVPLLEIYKRSLAIEDSSDDADLDDIDAEDRINVTGLNVPDGANADALLDDRSRNFLARVQMNPAVQAGIRRWLTDMRPSLMTSYENFQYLKPQMAPAFHKYGLSEALLFGIVAKESNGKVHVGSRVGAVGPLQFMPATGRRFGLGNDGTGFDTRYDPAMSAEAAASYIVERFAELNGSIEMALAAYNGGEGRALRIFNATGNKNFWDSTVYNQFPAETRDYVPMVIAAAWLYLHARDYGLRFPRISNKQVSLRLQKPTTLNEMTICMGNQRGTDGFQRALRNMNPRLDANQWLPAGTTLTVNSTMSRAYSWNCVNGKRADIARQVISADPSTAIVRVGALVNRTDASADNSDVVASNRPGDDATSNNDPAMVVQKPATAKSRAVITPAKSAAVTNSVPSTHRVRDGETLYSIARDYQCNVGGLISGNALKAPRYNIRPGQVLSLANCKP